MGLIRLGDKNWEVRHWRRVNVMARVVGIGFILWGTIFAISASYLLTHPEAPYNVNGVENHEVGPRITMAVMAFLVVILGVLLVKVRTYRPDLGDVSVLDRAFDPFRPRIPCPNRGRRSWWTGDPKTASDESTD